MINVRNYKVEISKISESDGGGYVATIPLLGCIGDGATIEEAINDVYNVAEAFISIAKERGMSIPQPDYYDNDQTSYSGRFTLRMPKTLHKQLARQAEKEGVSLNQLIITYISMGLGNSFGQSQVTIYYNDRSTQYSDYMGDIWEKIIGVDKGNRKKIMKLENLWR